MQKKTSSSYVTTRAWKILRLALLWARKGGVFKTRLILNLYKNLKTLRHIATSRSGATFYYGERQLSFDDTPIFHVKMHRPNSLGFKLPRIPCINSQVDFDYNFNDESYDNDVLYYNDGARESFLIKDNEDNEEEEINVGACDAGIDKKAEEFIANFYQQLKLQRQISYLQYNEKIAS